VLADEKVIASICMTVLTYVFGIFQLSIYAFISDLFITCAAKLCLVFWAVESWHYNLLLYFYHTSFILCSVLCQFPTN